MPAKGASSMAINSNVGGPKATKHANNRQGGARKKIADTLQIIRAPKNAGQKRRRAELIHNGLRRICQLSFFLAFPAVFSASFNGIKYVFSQLGGQQPIELTGFVALLLAILAFTCVFGRFFCGYACAFGTLGDAVFALAAPLRRALKLEGHKPYRMPAGAQSALQLIKFFVLAAICILSFMGIWSQVAGLSPWVAFAAIDARNLDGIAAGAFVALVLVMLGMALAERFFCQFLCPLGAIFSLLPVLPISQFNRDRTRCAKRCNRCQDRCPVRIHPDRNDLKAGECIACGRCADGCPMANVTLLRIERGMGDEPRNLCGNGVVAVLIKAAILAAICLCLL